jgi:dual specificity protein kinase YAK1
MLVMKSIHMLWNVYFFFRFKIFTLGILGKGSFGIVCRCINKTTHESYAMKIIKNLPPYNKQAETEKQVLMKIKDYDANDEFHMLRLVEYFIYHNHFCFVTELLGIDLYAVLKQNRFRGFPLSLISKVLLFFIYLCIFLIVLNRL